MDEMSGVEKEEMDLSAYETYTPAENPEGLIRELTIPAEMVVDMSRPKIISPKPDKKETALRALAFLCCLLLITAAASLLQAMPHSYASFWYMLTDVRDSGKLGRDIFTLRLSLLLSVACLLVCIAGLPLLHKVRRHTASRLVLFSAAALVSVLLIIYTLSIL